MRATPLAVALCRERHACTSLGKRSLAPQARAVAGFREGLSVPADARRNAGAGDGGIVIEDLRRTGIRRRTRVVRQVDYRVYVRRGAADRSPHVKCVYGVGKAAFVNAVPVNRSSGTRGRGLRELSGRSARDREIG